ncbi:MAG TPA: metallophosphoesterase [Acidobacteriaceae bacterium]|nr:metallophosphoesterase [Acidobacteriaceae bacterium]
MSLLRCHRMLGPLLACGMLWVGAGVGDAQTHKAESVPVVMLSDIHFDPFHDPAKFDKLRAAPVAEWSKILAEPDSPTQLADATKLARGCGTRGMDTPWVLLESSLAAAHSHSPHPLFVTVSGDLLAHAFECRFQTLAHKPSAEEQSAFAAKTLDYVAKQLRRTFPSIPIYMALGNNDSGCGDYRDSPNSDFLKSAAQSFSDDLESPVARKDLLQSFPVGGDYSVALPKPIVRGRLIVLQDIFLAVSHVGCDGKRDPGAAAAQLEWLRTELAEAHARNEQVWVMAHIPPGVNFYTTLSSKRDVCKGQAPVMFLHDEKLVDVLTDFAAEIRLVIFAHTHMDEMRLLQVGNATATPDADAAIKPAWVAAKLVPSISPINGNNPTFTLADIDPKTATMKDYRVFSADNKTGIAAKWSEGYRYSTAYHSTGFTPEEVARLMEKFGADKQGEAPESQEYESNFMPGGGLRSLGIRLVWPQYVCSMRQNTAAGFRDCMCPATP